MWDVLLAWTSQVARCTDPATASRWTVLGWDQPLGPCVLSCGRFGAGLSKSSREPRRLAEESARSVQTEGLYKSDGTVVTTGAERLQGRMGSGLAAEVDTDGVVVALVFGQP